MTTGFWTPPGVELKIGRSPWNPELHPRDRKGRFIETGGRVKISKIIGGGFGTVLRNAGGGRIEVRRDDGAVVRLATGFLEVVSRPGGGKPISRRTDLPQAVPIHAPSPHATELGAGLPHPDTISHADHGFTGPAAEHHAWDHAFVVEPEGDKWKVRHRATGLELGQEQDRPASREAAQAVAEAVFSAKDKNGSTIDWSSSNPDDAYKAAKAVYDPETGGGLEAVIARAISGAPAKPEARRAGDLAAEYGRLRSVAVRNLKPGDEVLWSKVTGETSIVQSVEINGGEAAVHTNRGVTRGLTPDTGLQARRPKATPQPSPDTHDGAPAEAGPPFTPDELAKLHEDTKNVPDSAKNEVAALVTALESGDKQAVSDAFHASFEALKKDFGAPRASEQWRHYLMDLQAADAERRRAGWRPGQPVGKDNTPHFAHPDNGKPITPMKTFAGKWYATSPVVFDLGGKPYVQTYTLTKDGKVGSRATARPVGDFDKGTVGEFPGKIQAEKYNAARHDLSALPDPPAAEPGGAQLTEHTPAVLADGHVAGQLGIDVGAPQGQGELGLGVRREPKPEKPKPPPAPPEQVPGQMGFDQPPPAPPAQAPPTPSPQPSPDRRAAIDAGYAAAGRPAGGVRPDGTPDRATSSATLADRRAQLQDARTRAEPAETARADQGRIYDTAPDTPDETPAVPGVTEEELQPSPVLLEGEKFPPTPQQQAVIDAAVAGKDTIVEAKAGTGKTTTLEKLARRMPQEKIGYIAFNKSVQVEAEARMPGNVEPRTGHSLAYAWAGRKFTEKKFPKGRPAQPFKVRPDDIAQHLGFSDTHGLTREEQAQAAVRTVDSYATSADDKIGAQHLPDRIRGELDAAGKAAMLANAEKLWADLQNPDGRVKTSFDHVRKMWALSRPDFTKPGSGLKTPATVLFLDEAQDTPPVLAKVVADQKMRKVIVGDADQAIYGFTGATDYLSTAKGDVRLPLDKSWRYGPGIADWGNRFLQVLGSKGRVTGAGPDSVIHEPSTMQGADAILVRSNGGAIGEIVREQDAGRLVGVTKGTKSDLALLVESARYLQGKGKAPIRMHEDLEPFRTWAEVVKEAGKGDDPKIAMLERMVRERGLDNLDHIVQQLVEPGGGLTGVSFDELDQGLAISGNTFPIKDKIKAAGFRWTTLPSGDKRWVAVGAPDQREATLARLRESVDGRKPDVTVSTAHKAKGLEWGRVRIGDDFRGPQQNKETGELVMPSPEELRLAYVAVTRAETQLDPGSLSWVLGHSDANGGDPNAPGHGVPDLTLAAPDVTPAAPEVPAAGAEPALTPEAQLNKMSHDLFYGTGFEAGAGSPRRREAAASRVDLAVRASGEERDQHLKDAIEGLRDSEDPAELAAADRLEKLREDLGFEPLPTPRAWAGIPAPDDTLTGQQALNDLLYRGRHGGFRDLPEVAERMREWTATGRSDGSTERWLRSDPPAEQVGDFLERLAASGGPQSRANDTWEALRGMQQEIAAADKRGEPWQPRRPDVTPSAPHVPSAPPAPEPQPELGHGPIKGMKPADMDAEIGRLEAFGEGKLSDLGKARLGLLRAERDRRAAPAPPKRELPPKAKTTDGVLNVLAEVQGRSAGHEHGADQVGLRKDALRKAIADGLVRREDTGDPNTDGGQFRLHLTDAGAAELAADDTYASAAGLPRRPRPEPAPPAAPAPAVPDVQATGLRPPAAQRGDVHERVQGEDLKVGDVIYGKYADGEHGNLLVESVTNEAGHVRATGVDENGNRNTVRWPQEHPMARRVSTPGADAEPALDRVLPDSGEPGPVLPDDLRVGDVFDGKVPSSPGGRKFTRTVRVVREAEGNGFNRQVQVEFVDGSQAGERTWLNLNGSRPVIVSERGPEKVATPGGRAEQPHPDGTIVPEPAAPGVPPENVPNEPGTPEPNAPGEPNAPAEPTAPNEPNAPSAPNEPGPPSDPNAPGEGPPPENRPSPNVPGENVPGEPAAPPEPSPASPRPAAPSAPGRRTPDRPSGSSTSGGGGGGDNNNGPPRLRIPHRNNRNVPGGGGGGLNGGGPDGLSASLPSIPHPGGTGTGAAAAATHGGPNAVPPQVTVPATTVASAADVAAWTSAHFGGGKLAGEVRTFLYPGPTDNYAQAVANLGAAAAANPDLGRLLTTLSPVGFDRGVDGHRVFNASRAADAARRFSQNDPTLPVNADGRRIRIDVPGAGGATHETAITVSGVTSSDRPGHLAVSGVDNLGNRHTVVVPADASLDVIPEAAAQPSAVKTDMRPARATYQGRRLSIQKSDQFGLLQATINGEHAYTTGGSTPADMTRAMEQLRRDVAAADVARRADPGSFPDFWFGGAPPVSETLAPPAAPSFATAHAAREALWRAGATSEANQLAWATDRVIEAHTSGTPAERAAAQNALSSVLNGAEANHGGDPQLAGPLSAVREQFLTGQPGPDLGAVTGQTPAPNAPAAATGIPGAVPAGLPGGAPGAPGVPEAAGALDNGSPGQGILPAQLTPASLGDRTGHPDLATKQKQLLAGFSKDPNPQVAAAAAALRTGQPLTAGQASVLADHLRAYARQTGEAAAANPGTPNADRFTRLQGTASSAAARLEQFSAGLRAARAPGLIGPQHRTAMDLQVNDRVHLGASVDGPAVTGTVVGTQLQGGGRFVAIAVRDDHTGLVQTRRALPGSNMTAAPAAAPDGGTPAFLPPDSPPTPGGAAPDRPSPSTVGQVSTGDTVAIPNGDGVLHGTVTGIQDVPGGNASTITVGTPGGPASAVLPDAHPAFVLPDTSRPAKQPKRNRSERMIKPGKLVVGDVVWPDGTPASAVEVQSVTASPGGHHTIRGWAVARGHVVQHNIGPGAKVWLQDRQLGNAANHTPAADPQVHGLPAEVDHKSVQVGDRIRIRTTWGQEWTGMIVDAWDQNGADPQKGSPVPGMALTVLRDGEAEPIRHNIYAADTMDLLARLGAQSAEPALYRARRDQVADAMRQAHVQAAQVAADLAQQVMSRPGWSPQQFATALHRDLYRPAGEPGGIINGRLAAARRDAVAAIAGDRRLDPTGARYAAADAAMQHIQQAQVQRIIAALGQTRQQQSAQRMAAAVAGAGPAPIMPQFRGEADQLLRGQLNIPIGPAPAAPHVPATPAAPAPHVPAAPAAPAAPRAVQVDRVTTARRALPTDWTNVGLGRTEQTTTPAPTAQDLTAGHFDAPATSVQLAPDPGVAAGHTAAYQSAGEHIAEVADTHTAEPAQAAEHAGQDLAAAQGHADAAWSAHTDAWHGGGPQAASAVDTAGPTAQLRAAHAEQAKAEAKLAQARTEADIGALEQVRPMGAGESSPADRYATSSAEMRQAMADTEAAFPRDWLTAAQDSGKVALRTGPVTSYTPAHGGKPAEASLARGADGTYAGAARLVLAEHLRATVPGLDGAIAAKAGQEDPAAFWARAVSGTGPDAEGHRQWLLGVMATHGTPLPHRDTSPGGVDAAQLSTAPDPLAGVDLAALSDGELNALLAQHGGDDTVWTRLENELDRRDSGGAVPPPGQDPLAGKDLQNLSDDELFALHSQDGMPQDAIDRIEHEMDRRDAGGAATETRPLTDSQRQVAALEAQGMSFFEAFDQVHGIDSQTRTRMEKEAAVDAERLPGETREQTLKRMYQDWVDAEYFEAEQATRGHLLTREGEAAGIDPAALFSGQTARARKFASEELKRWWAESNRRRTFTQFKADMLGREGDVTAAEQTRASSNNKDFL